MPELGSVAWPPSPILTERLVLRPARATDRAVVIELMASEDVHAHLGGPRPRGELERMVPAVPGQRPGFFVVDRGDETLGVVILDRRDPDRPGRLGQDGGEIELSYLFLPMAWGCGFATEACAAVLDWVVDVLPGEPVVLCTQSANVASVRVAEKLGFVEHSRFEEFGAEQWFGVR